MTKILYIPSGTYVQFASFTAGYPDTSTIYEDSYWYVTREDNIQKVIQTLCEPDTKSRLKRISDIPTHESLSPEEFEIIIDD